MLCANPNCANVLDQSGTILRIWGNAIYDTGAATPYLRHRATCAAHAPDRPATATAVLAWCRAIIEAVMYPKRSITRGDTGYLCEPAEYSDWCRKYVFLNTLPVSPIRYLRHRCTFVAHPPERPDAGMAVVNKELRHRWCRTSIVSGSMASSSVEIRSSWGYHHFFWAFFLLSVFLLYWLCQLL